MTLSRSKPEMTAHVKGLDVNCLFADPEHEAGATRGAL